MPDADKRIVTAIKMIMPKLRLASHKKCPEDTDFIVAFGIADTSSLWHKMDNKEECGLLAFGSAEEISGGITLDLSSKDFRLLLRKEGMHSVKYDI